MGKSSSGRSRTGSEVSASRSERRRSTIDDNESTSTVTPSRMKSRTDSTTSGTSSSRRRSSRPDAENNEPESSSKRASNYSVGSYAPSNATSTYMTAVDGNQDESPRAERRETSRRERDSMTNRDGSRSESTRALKDDNSRGDERRSSYSRRDSEKTSSSSSSKRRDSKRQSTSSYTPERRESQREGSRALSEQDHNAALPHNQFPNEIPDNFAAPYRPPGLAEDYYGDHGESVQFQPGVRPNIPNIIQTADQAHLHEPTVEAHPPPEPSSLGHVGAAASYFGTDEASGTGELTTPSRPSQSVPSGQPQASPRASPGPPTSRPSIGRPPSFGGNIGSVGVVAAAGAGAGLAAEYFAGHDFTSQTNHQSSSHQAFQESSQYSQYNQSSQSQHAQGPQNQFSQGFQSGHGSTSRPPAQSHAGPGLGTAAVAGLAAAGAASYYSHHHDNHSQSQSQFQGQQNHHASGSVLNLAGGQSQTSLSFEQQQRLKQKHKHQGPISRFVDWFRDPRGVAQYEAYTEAIGVCKYCFDPNSSPLDAPRKHHYCNGRPSSVNPTGKFTSRRVTKAYRYSNGSSSSLSSSDEERRRRKSSTGKKIVAAGLAGAGAAKIGEALYNRKNDFDDTYSIRSGRPISDMQQRMQTNASRIEAEEAEARRRSEKRQSTRSRYESTEDVRLDRKSSTTSRKSRRESEGVEVRRSSRRDNSGSPSRLSRGQAMSIGAGAAVAAAAIGAEVAHRRRSRSRSRSRSNSPTLRRKKSYYSKRVSPKHSYVDLSTKNTGPLGFGGFFSSPSANERRGKKKKGLFVFRNDSSSSSDADLAFGEGTIKRKSSRKAKARRDSKDGLDGKDAILGLAATGAALAAESEYRKSSGKSRRDTNGKSGRSSAYKISMQDNEVVTSDVNDEGVWEDASDNDSVDTALAYGGRLSARTSRESLAEQGTSKWDWRWKDKKAKKTAGNERRQSESFARPQPSRFDAAATAVVGAGIGAAAADAVSHGPPSVQHQPHYIYSEPSPSTMAPMQYVDPFATSNPGFFDARATSTVDGGPSPHTFESRSPAPLKQPQPQSARVSSITTAKPTVLDRIEAEAKLTGSPEEISSSEKTRSERRNRADSQERTRPSRRDSSPPPINPSTTSRNSVMFNLTDEQIEAERIANDKEERRRRRKERERDGKRQSADFTDSPTTTPAPPVSKAASAPDLTRNVGKERPKKSRTTSLNEHEDREAAIERELEALYAQQDRYMKQQKELDEYRRKHGESGGISAALVGAGVGAAVTAMVKDKKSSESESDRKPPPKPSLKKSSQERVASPPKSPPRSLPESRPESPPKETQQERIARMAAQRVRSTPSPVHENYSTFFVPEEIAGSVKDHNEAAEKRAHDLANVITIDPDDGSPVQPTFDPFVYLQYGLSRRHDASKYGWKVPMLELEEPTPPGSRSSSRARQGEVDLGSPVSPARGVPVAAALPKDSLESLTDNDLPRPVATSSTGSKVTFGGHSTHEYEVQTPEYERNDPHNDSIETREIPALEHDVSETTSREPARKVYSIDKRGDDPKVTEVPPVEEMTPEQREHVSRGRDFKDMHSTDRQTDKSFTHDHHVTPIYEHREPSPSPEPSPMIEPDIKELLGGKYMAPFSETVSDLGDVGDYSHREVPKTGQGFVESEELPTTPVAEIPMNGEASHHMPKESRSSAIDDTPLESRLSRSERRRLERAMSSSENTTPVVRTPQPEPEITARDDLSEHAVAKEMQQIKPERQGPDMGVFDFLVDENDNPIPSSDIPAYNDLVKSAISQMSRGSAERTQKHEEKHTPTTPSKPHRSYTLDDSQFEREVARSTDYASDPEDWERTSGKKSQKSKESSSASKSDVGFGTKAALAGVAGGAVAATVAAAAAHGEPDFYAVEKEKSRESRRKKRESEIFDDYDGKSTVSLPATRDEDKKSRKRSKRRDSDDIEDEDRKSIASLPATKDEDDRSRRKKRDSDVFKNDDDDTKSVKSVSSEKRKSREKERERERVKETKSSGIFGLFGKSSDISTSSKKSSKSESRAERDRTKDKHDEDRERRRKRRSKGDGYYDDAGSVASEPLRSSHRSKSHDAEDYERATQESRDVSVDDGFVSADDGQQSKPESFLVERPEMPTPTAIEPVMDTVMPMVTDGVSGPNTENVAEVPVSLEPEAEKEGLVTGDDDYRTPEQLPLPTQSKEEERALSEVEPEQDLPLLATTPQADRQRRLSAIRTAGYASSPMSLQSPTAVPLQFGRRYPVTPGGTTQAAARSSPNAGMPSSPLSTPRTRQGRPKSYDFSSSREYRPLYLVEHHSATKATTPDIDENLPSLPSSRSTSAHPSTEDLRGQAMAQLEGHEDGYFAQSPATDDNTFHDAHDQRPMSPDFLDSRSATPVPGERQRARDQDQIVPIQTSQPQQPLSAEEIQERRARQREREMKLLFHSPSELLQDPVASEHVHPSDVDIAEVDRAGSPLPSVVSTSQDEEFLSAESGRATPVFVDDEPRQPRPRSPSQERSRSRRRDDAIAAGLGLLGGVAAGAAVGVALKAGEPEESTNVETASREVPVDNTLPLSNESEDADTKEVEKDTEPAVSAKKSKKKKKDKRKSAAEAASLTKVEEREPLAEDVIEPKDESFLTFENDAPSGIVAGHPTESETTVPADSPKRALADDLPSEDSATVEQDTAAIAAPIPNIDVTAEADVEPDVFEYLDRSKEQASKPTTPIAVKESAEQTAEPMFATLSTPPPADTTTDMPAPENDAPREVFFESEAGRPSVAVKDEIDTTLSTSVEEDSVDKLLTPGALERSTQPSIASEAGNGFLSLVETPLSNTSEVQEEKTEAELPSIASGKKGKKDRKKKRRTLDAPETLASSEPESRVEATTISPELTEEAATKAVSPDDMVPGDALAEPEPIMADQPSTIEQEQSVLELTQGDEQVQPSSSKKSKKKGKGKKLTTKDNSLDTTDAATEKFSVDESQVTTALPLTEDLKDASPNELDLALGAGAVAVAAAAGSALFRDTPAVDQNDEAAIEVEEPIPEAREVLEEAPATAVQTIEPSLPDTPVLPDLSRTTSFQPDAAQLAETFNDLGAFEQAFERALQSRGLADYVTREDALEAFLPRRDNAPFIPKGGLTPVPEGTPATAPATPDEEMGGLSRTSSKKEKRKGKKGKAGSGAQTRSSNESLAFVDATSTSVELLQDDEQIIEKSLSKAENPFGQDYEIGPSTADEVSNVIPTSLEKNPFGNDFEINPTVDETQQQPETADRNPFGNDFDVKVDDQTEARTLEEPQLEGVAQQSDKALEDIPVEDAPQRSNDTQEQPSSLVEEPGEARATKSKKDKKKKRKDKISIQDEESSQPQTSTEQASQEPHEPPLGESVNEPIEIAVPSDAEAPSHETPEDPAEAEQLSVAPKSKKDKRKKKNQNQALPSTTDLEESVLPQEEKSRELDTQPTDSVDIKLQTEDEPVNLVEGGDDSMASTSSKKSKKDKKKKKQSGSDWTDEFGSAAVVAGTIAAGASAMGMFASTDDKAEVVEEPKELESTYQPREIQADSTIAPVFEEATEGSAPVSSKKSKKDKKKKKSKSSASSDWENEETAAASTFQVDEEAFKQAEPEPVSQDRDNEVVAPAVPEVPMGSELENTSYLEAQEERDNKEREVIEPAVPEIFAEPAEDSVELPKTEEYAGIGEVAERSFESQHQDALEQAADEVGAGSVKAVLEESSARPDQDVEDANIDLNKRDLDLPGSERTVQVNDLPHQDITTAEDSVPASELEEPTLLESAAAETTEGPPQASLPDVVEQSREIDAPTEELPDPIIATKKSKKDKKKKKRQSVTWEDESSTATPSASGVQTPAEVPLQSQQSVDDQGATDEPKAGSARNVDGIQTSDATWTSTDDSQVQEKTQNNNGETPVRQAEDAEGDGVPESSATVEERALDLYSEPVTPIEEPSRPIPEAQPIDDWTAPPKKGKKGKKGKAKGPPAPWDSNISLGQATGIALAGTAALLGAAVAKKSKERGPPSPSSFKPYRAEAVEAQEIPSDKSVQPLELTPVDPSENEQAQQTDQMAQTTRGMTANESVEETPNAADISNFEASTNKISQGDLPVQEEQGPSSEQATSIPLLDNTLPVSQIEGAARDIASAETAPKDEVVAPSPEKKTEEPQPEGESQNLNPVASSDAAEQIQAGQEKSFEDVVGPTEGMQIVATASQPEPELEAAKSMDKENDPDTSSSTRKSKKDKKKKRKSSTFETSEPATPLDEQIQPPDANVVTAAQAPIETASEDASEAIKTAGEDSNLEHIDEVEPLLDENPAKSEQEMEEGSTENRATAPDELDQQEASPAPVETTELLDKTTTSPNEETDFVRDTKEVPADIVDPAEASQERQSESVLESYVEGEGETGLLPETDQPWYVGLSKKERKKKKKAMEAEGVTFDEFDQPIYPGKDEEPAPEVVREPIAKGELVSEAEPIIDTPVQDNESAGQEPAPSSSRKKSKKDKKKEKLTSSMSIEEPTAFSEEPAKEPEDNIELGITGSAKDDPGSRQEDPSIEDIQTATVQETQLIQDDKPSGEALYQTPRTKSKKDKKKRKSGLSTPAEDPVVTDENLTKEHGSADVTEHTVQPLEPENPPGPEITPEPAEPIEPEQSLEPDNAMELGERIEPKPNLVQPSPKIAAVTSEIPASGLLPDNVTQPESEREIQELDEVQSEPPSHPPEQEQTTREDEPEGEDIPAASTKKAKKDKKKKRKASVALPIEEPAATTEGENEGFGHGATGPKDPVSTEITATEPETTIDHQEQAIDSFTTPSAEMATVFNDQVKETEPEVAESSLPALGDSTLTDVTFSEVTSVEQLEDTPAEVIPETEAEDTQASGGKKSKKSKKKRKSTLSTPVDEPATQVDEPATQVDEPATQVDEPATQVDEPATQVDEPATQVDELASGPSSNLIEQENPVVAEPESIDPEPQANPAPNSLEEPSDQLGNEPASVVHQESEQDTGQHEPELSVPIEESSCAFEEVGQVAPAEESLPPRSAGESAPMNVDEVPARSVEEDEVSSQKPPEEPEELTWNFSSKKSKKDKKKRKSGSSTPAENSTITDEPSIETGSAARDIDDVQPSTVEDGAPHEVENAPVEDVKPEEHLNLSRKSSKKDKKKKKSRASDNEQTAPQPEPELESKPAQDLDATLSEPQVPQNDSVSFHDDSVNVSHEQTEPQDMPSGMNESVPEVLPTSEPQVDLVQLEHGHELQHAENNQTDQIIETVQKPPDTEMVDRDASRVPEILDDDGTDKDVVRLEQNTAVAEEPSIEGLTSADNTNPSDITEASNLHDSSHKDHPEEESKDTLVNTQEGPKMDEQQPSQSITEEEWSSTSAKSKKSKKKSKRKSASADNDNKTAEIGAAAAIAALSAAVPKDEQATEQELGTPSSSEEAMRDKADAEAEQAVIDDYAPIDKDVQDAKDAEQEQKVIDDYVDTEGPSHQDTWAEAEATEQARGEEMDAAVEDLLSDGSKPKDEDTSWMKGNKKGKKGKKAKRASEPLDQPSQPLIPASEPSAEAQSTEAFGAADKEEVTAVDELERATSATVPEEALITPAAEQSDGFSWTSALKKDKKGKKKRRSVAWADDDTSAPVTPANEKAEPAFPQEEEMPTESTKSEPLTLVEEKPQIELEKEIPVAREVEPELAESDLTLMPSLEEISTGMKSDLPTPATEKEEFTWEAPPKKKGKKNKKNRGSVVDLDETSARDDTPPEQAINDSNPTDQLEDMTTVESSSKFEITESKQDKKRRSSFDTLDEPSTKRVELNDEDLQDVGYEPVVVGESTGMPSVLLPEGPLETIDVPDSTNIHDESIKQADEVQEPVELPLAQVAAQTAVADTQLSEPESGPGMAEVAAQKAFNDAVEADEPVAQRDVDPSPHSEQPLNPPAEVEEDIWATPGKKAKKDKKKKRQSQAEGPSAAEEALAAAAAATGIAGAAIMSQHDSHAFGEDQEISKPSNTSEADNEPAHPVVEAVWNDESIARDAEPSMEDNQPFSSKKSKKDKKKKKRQSTLAEPIEESTSGKASAESLAGPYTRNYDDEMALDALTADDHLVQSPDVVRDAIDQEPSGDLGSAERRERRHLTEEDLEPVGPTAGQEEELDTQEVKMTDVDNIGPTSGVKEDNETPIGIKGREIQLVEADALMGDSKFVDTETAGPEKKQDSRLEEAPPTMVEENFESELKDDSPWEMIEPDDKSKMATELPEVQTMAEPVVVEAEENFELPKSDKKSKKSKRKQLASTSQDRIEATTNVPLDEIAEIVTAEPQALQEQLNRSTSEEIKTQSQQGPELTIAESGEWNSDGKKTKKDKKKKRNSTLDIGEKTSREIQETTNIADPSDDVKMADVPLENTREGVFEENENKEATDEQSRALDMGDEAPTVVAEPEVAADERATSSKKSKKDKKKKRKSTIDVSEETSSAAQTPRSSQSQAMIVEEPVTTEPDRSIEVSEPQTYSVETFHNEPSHQAWLNAAFESASQYPSKPAIREENLPAAPTPLPVEPEDVLSASTKKDKKGKMARKISEPLPEATDVQDLKDVVPDSDLIMADQEQESDGSNISESTRERRKRRRSPPLQRDHDPDDLPRSPGSRALTPPPEHDDLMDTALGIAAGLGLGATEAGHHSDARPSEKTIRDSGVQFDDPSTIQTGSSVRDSGFVPSPLIDDSWSTSRGRDMQLSEPGVRRPTRPHSPTSSTEDVRLNRRSVHAESGEESQHTTHLGTGPRGLLETPAKRQPSPVNPTSKDRSSVLFHSSPAGQTPKTPHSGKRSQVEPSVESPTSELRRSPSIHGHRKSQEELHASGSSSDRRMSNELASSLINRAEAAEVDRSAFSPSPVHSPERPFSPTRTPLQTIHEGRSGQHSESLAMGALAAGGLAAGALAASARDDPTHRTRSLGKSKSRTGSLRDLRSSTTSPFNGPGLQPTPSRASVDDTGAGAEGAARNMAESFEGLGAYPASPASPTRPPSVKRRQSMQQIRDLEARVDQLANENRSLAEAKLMAERHLEDFQIDRNKNDFATDESLRTLNEQLHQRDEEILKLREQIETLAHTHESLKSEHETRYSALQDQHDDTHAQWQQSTRELEGLRSQHEELNSGMDDIVQQGINTALAEKNAEVLRLRRDLEAARQKIRELQSQILSHGADEVIVVRDEDYFDNACQALCQHVQQWVLRFSKFSDTRVCYGMDQVKDEKAVDRFDNAILDGSDVDTYLSDRVKRRDVFMSVVMTMIWEYVFGRYLFGMDRDQRQKLKQLEKNLLEIGPVNAVQRWRALTLTLLSKREVFRQQRESDSEAVVIEIMKTLKKFLPPPQNLEGQIHESLRKVMRAAADLAIEMRTQKAEYTMLPPLQPEYNTEGDLVRKVYFNASLMNERSGETSSNEELEASRAVVRIVLFPLVVKKGDDSGKGNEEIVVCPAQVLVARPDKGKRPKSRLASGGSDRMSMDQRAMKSTQSLGAMSGIEPSQGNMI